MRSLTVVYGLLGLSAPASSCSNILIPAGSSVDGSTILAYNADSPDQVGALAHWPAGRHGEGELRPTYNWDDGGYLGAIPQPRETYNVVGNMNEHQLSITETTYGGLKMLDGSGGNAVCNRSFGCLDYGQLIFASLARAKNAREAIDVVDDLLQTYGYASSGESFSIADTQEVWLMEIIGKGNYSQGAVWVATRIPDGSICAHANQARTQDFVLGEPERFRFSHDVVDFARSLGLHNGPDASFSFSDTYDPVTAYGARTCEARVFSLFSQMAAPEENIEQHLDYVMGRNINNCMPLYVRAGRKFSVNDTFWLMRDHYETTHLDARNDVGAGNWRSPIQLGSTGTVWYYEGRRYINERPVGVPFTQWNLVANQRPNQRFGVLWFGVDDSTFTIRAPFYGVATRFPAAWDDSNCTARDECREQLGLPGTIQKFSMQSMFWVTNMVANFAYSRYDDISPAVFRRLANTESRLQAAVAAQDTALLSLSDAAAREAATNFSFVVAEDLHKEWLDFYGELFVTYVDGYTMIPGAVPNSVKKIGSQLRGLMKAEIASQTGGKYRLPGHATASDGTNLAVVIDKRELRSMGHRHEATRDDTEWDGGDVVSTMWRTLFSGPVGYASCVALLVVGSFSSGVVFAQHQRFVTTGSFSDSLIA